MATQKLTVNGGAWVEELYEGGVKLANKYALKTHTHTKADITDFNNIPEAYLTWGGKNFNDAYGPIDAAMIPQLGANRFAYGKAAGITIEYSQDSGSTWTDYGAADAEKVRLFTTANTFTIGKSSSSNKATASSMLRVTISSAEFQLYTILNKFAIYITTNGSSGCYVKITAALQSTPTVFVDKTDNIPISGWSGWNIINIPSGICTYGNQPASQYGKLRFTFGCTGGSDTYYGLNINSIYGFGGVGWGTPSTLAQTGRLYTLEDGQSCTFPASVTAPTFIGNLSGKAVKADQDGDGYTIKTTYSKATNIKNSTSTGGLDQLHHGGDTFDFTDKNPNATTYEPTFTGTLTKGAFGDYASSFGGKSVAIGEGAFAEGAFTIAQGAYSHAEGEGTVALDDRTHAEGYITTAVGMASHAEGYSTVAEGVHSHAEGNQTLAQGTASHAEGMNTTASGVTSHAEGYVSTASGVHSHAEGRSSTATGDASHAEGLESYAAGMYSHAEGSYTKTSNDSEHASGTYNKTNTGTLFSVGIGTRDTDRKNAFEIDKDGNVYVYGLSYTGISPSSSNTLKAYITSAVADAQVNIINLL